MRSCLSVLAYLADKGRAPRTLINMGWKDRITLGDLPPTTQLELTCKSCGTFRYISIGKLKARHPAKSAMSGAAGARAVSPCPLIAIVRAFKAG